MKTAHKALGGTVFAAIALVVSGALAQQRPAPKLVSYPMPAAQYEAHVSKILKVLREARPIGPITRADFDKAIFITRECASTVEADGIVTASEAQGCRARLVQFKRERLREIMATSSPADWARWRAQMPNMGDKDE
jgi:hypothetical protein